MSHGCYWQAFTFIYSYLCLAVFLFSHRLSSSLSFSNSLQECRLSFSLISDNLLPPFVSAVGVEGNHTLSLYFYFKYHFSHNHNWNITSTVVSVHTRYLLLTLLVFLRYPFSVPHSSLQIHQALSIELSASVVCSGLQQFSLGFTVGATQGVFLRPIQHCLYCVV